jgi:hypothetical protein
MKGIRRSPSQVRKKREVSDKRGFKKKPRKVASNDRKSQEPQERLFAEWDREAAQERLAWRNRPSIPLSMIGKELLSRELAKAGISSTINVSKELYVREKNVRKQVLEEFRQKLGWNEEKLELFMVAADDYRLDPTIQNYLNLQQKFPDVQIPVVELGGFDALIALSDTFEAQGIPPQMIAGALDLNEPLVDKLCLHLLKLIVDRESLPKTGPGHISRRRKAVSDATANYLIATLVEYYHFSEFEWRFPASLVWLIKHQLCADKPDLEAEYRSRQRRLMLAWSLGEQLGPNGRVSGPVLQKCYQMPRASAYRLARDPEFLRMVDSFRASPAEVEKRMKLAAKRMLEE